MHGYVFNYWLALAKRKIKGGKKERKVTCTLFQDSRDCRIEKEVQTSEPTRRCEDTDSKEIRERKKNGVGCKKDMASL